MEIAGQLVTAEPPVPAQIISTSTLNFGQNTLKSLIFGSKNPFFQGNSVFFSQKPSFLGFPLLN
jgi:hypothetical protein